MTLSGDSVLEAGVQLFLAFLLALPLGWAHERGSRSVGFRTYPLLSVCVCGFLVVAADAGWETREQADAFYGVLTGIGFVGSGAIVKSREHVQGMSMAVSLWVTGAIGAGVAYGALLLSAALSLTSLATLLGPRLVAGRRGAP